MRLRGLNKRNLGSGMEPHTESEQSRQAPNCSHNLALWLCVISNNDTLFCLSFNLDHHLQMGAIKPPKNNYSIPVLFCCLLKSYYNFTARVGGGWRNKVIAVNTSEGIYLHLHLFSWIFTDWLQALLRYKVPQMLLGFPKSTKAGNP